MKKTLAVILAAMMLVAVFAGCTKKDAETTPPADESPIVESETPDNNDVDEKADETPDENADENADETPDENADEVPAE